MRDGLDIEQLDARRFMHVIMNFFVEDAMFEYANERDEARGSVLSKMKPGYNSKESYGRSNDNSEPLPYIPVTDQTEDGYVGLDPPVG